MADPKVDRWVEPRVSSRAESWAALMAASRAELSVDLTAVLWVSELAGWKVDGMAAVKVAQ